MKRLYIVVEGQTEQEFVNSILRPHLNSFGIYNVTAILIHTSKTGRGGLCGNYEYLENTINGLLKSSHDKADFTVTTFVDFFRIPKNMPRYEESMSKVTRIAQIESLEQAMNGRINDRRFYPYIQLHEFESLLFSNNKGFEYYFDEKEFKATEDVIKNYPNPEDINTTPNGAPSKRILVIKGNYDKITEGNLIALEVGITDILSKCPRFNGWVESLITTCRLSP